MGKKKKALYPSLEKAENSRAKKKLKLMKDKDKAQEERDRRRAERTARKRERETASSFLPKPSSADQEPHEEKAAAAAAERGGDGPIRLREWWVSIERIDPILARLYLDEQPTNRSLRSGNVHRFAEDMKEERWLLTHQALAFDEKDGLLDGQHRLSAVVKADKAQEFVVFRKVPRDTFHVLDLHSKRSAADALLVNDASLGKYARRMTSVARVVIRGPVKMNAKNALRHHQLVTHCVGHQSLYEDYISRFAKTEFRRLYSAGWVGSLCTAALIFGRDKIDPIMIRLSEMEFEGSSDPIKALFKYLSSRGNTSSRSDFVRRAGWVHLSYKAATVAVNAAIVGKSLSSLRVGESTKDYKGAAELRAGLVR